MMLAAINLAFFVRFFWLWGIHHTNSATSSSFDVTRHLSVGDVLFYPNRIHPISTTARFKYSKMDPFGTKSENKKFTPKGEGGSGRQASATENT